VESASLVLGIDPKHLSRFKGAMTKALASNYCKRVLCWAEVGRRSLLADLNSEAFAHKVTVVPYAVPPKRFQKACNDGRHRLLFVGSGTSKGGFDFRGGREALETFALLRQRYDNVEMVVRSDVPPDVKSRYRGMSGLRIIDDFISREEMDHEYRSADIFIIPSHNTSPMIVLDAMSYELPVVTINTWANPEYVADGKTGLVACSSTKLQYYNPGTHQPNWANAAFQRAIRTPDPDVVSDLVSKVAILIEDVELRRRLGKAARWEVEHGRFSLTSTNQMLARIFDEAIDDRG
jgi:glycosyltransferase involved in cell wall biosynthesis